MSAVPSDDIKMVDSHLLDGIYHGRSIESSSGGTKHCATKIVNVFDDFRVQIYPILRKLLIEAAVAPLDTPYLLDIVVIPK